MFTEYTISHASGEQTENNSGYSPAIENLFIWHTYLLSYD
jgi:hypothetical protein